MNKSVCSEDFSFFTARLSAALKSLFAKPIFSPVRLNWAGLCISWKFWSTYRKSEFTDEYSCCDVVRKLTVILMLPD